MGIWVIPGNHWSIGMTRCFLSFLCHLALMDMAQVTTPSPTDTDEEPVKNACTEVFYVLSVFINMKEHLKFLNNDGYIYRVMTLWFN